MSTPVSLSRADLAPSIAESYRAILENLGEDSERAGLKDSEYICP
jgi:GTP cyclohydrolase I